MDIVKYVFCPGSVEGLEEYVELWAHNFIEAKERVLKYVYMGRTSHHPLRGDKINGWGQREILE